ncbi:MAG: carbohydrate ABC transporter permease [Bacillota bacterium]
MLKNQGLLKKVLPILKSPYLLLVPALLFYVLFWLLPVSLSIFESFTTAEGDLTFQNFVRMVQESKFNRALINTLLFAIVSLVLQFFLAVMLALLINRKFKGSKLFLFFMMIPMALPQAAVGVLWTTGLIEFGWLNSILEISGLQTLMEQGDLIDGRQSWTTMSGTKALVALIFIDTWTVLPSVMIIILAGLQNFNDELKESALVFGASRSKAIKDIVIPIIKPSIVTALLLRLIAGLQMWLVVVMIFGYQRVPFLLERVVYYSSVVSRTDANYKMAITYSVFTLVLIILVAFAFVRLTSGKTDWRKADE